MKRVCSFRCLAAGAIATCVLLAPRLSPAAPVTYDQEVQANAGVFHAQSSDVGTVAGDVSYGFFFNPALEVGLRQTANYAFIDDARDAWLLTTTPFLNLHYNTSPDQVVVPYVGTFIGAVYNDINATGTLGPAVGLKIFMNEQTFLNVGYRYEWFFEEIEGGGLTDEADQGNHVGTVGIGFVFGGDRPDVVRTSYTDETVLRRTEDAAARAEDAATRTEAAARRIENVANEAESDFDRGLRK